MSLLDFCYADKLICLCTSMELGLDHSLTFFVLNKNSPKLFTCFHQSVIVSYLSQTVLAQSVIKPDCNEPFLDKSAKSNETRTNTHYFSFDYNWSALSNNAKPSVTTISDGLEKHQSKNMRRPAFIQAQKLALKRNLRRDLCIKQSKTNKCSAIFKNHYQIFNID